METHKIKALLFMKSYSERVPRKNMKNFCGRPLFHWIMDTLNHSKYINEIIINTDSDEIAKSAQDNFEVTVHMRPDHLLTITSNEANSIMAYDLSISDGNYFLQTHSTNPLLTTESINRSIVAFLSQRLHDSLFSVTALQTRLFFKDGKPINHDPKKLIKTQDLPPVYEENSCIYIFSRKSFTETGNRIGKTPMLFPIKRLEAVDIDDMDDFVFAEYLMKKRTSNEL